MNSLVPGLPAEPSFESSRQSRLSPEDREALERAIGDLECSSFAIRICGILGQRASALAAAVPPQLAQIAGRAAEAAVRASLGLALRSLAGKPLADRRRIHRTAAALAGAAGGAFGLPTLALELPFSTTIMLRSIADIARAEGHDLTDPLSALACIEVFALGTQARDKSWPEFPGRSEEGPLLGEAAGLEAGYFGLRAVLAKTISEAAEYLTRRGIMSEAAPALVRFMTQVGSRFGVAVSQKLLAQTVPIVGALSGAAINYAFADHFQRIARGHFTVLRLERRYGGAAVRAEYEVMRNRI